MKHELAIASHAAERYLMGEMSAEERDAFEDHFFSCATCAEDLRAAARFIEGSRIVFQEEESKPRRLSLTDWLRSKWLSPALVAVSAAACGVIIFQNTVTIPRLDAPRALPPIDLDLTSRAASVPIHPGDPLSFQIGAEQAPSTPEIRAELRTESGRLVNQGTITAPPPHKPINVYFPGVVKPGRYIITIRSMQNGRPGEPIARNSFEVAAPGSATIDERKR